MGYEGLKKEKGDCLHNSPRMVEGGELESGRGRLGREGTKNKGRQNVGGGGDVRLGGGATPNIPSVGKNPETSGKKYEGKNALEGNVDEPARKNGFHFRKQRGRKRDLQPLDNAQKLSSEKTSGKSWDSNTRIKRGRGPGGPRGELWRQGFAQPRKGLLKTVAFENGTARTAQKSGKNCVGFGEAKKGW